MSAALSRRMGAVLLLACAAYALGCGDDDDDACKPGAAGCACSDGDAGAVCDDGLACMQGKCVRERELHAVVSDRRARACDALVLESGARVAGVSFGEGAIGTFVREAPRVAVSFIASADKPIPESAVRVRVNGEASDLDVAHVECADANGDSIEGATLSLRE